MSGPANYEQLGIPFQRHSDTSRAAAESVADKVPSRRARVLACLLLRGPVGCTDEELEDLLRLGPNSARPRRVALKKEGLVRDSGQTRKTRLGNEATVWVATGREP